MAVARARFHALLIMYASRLALVTASLPSLAGSARCATVQCYSPLARLLTYEPPGLMRATPRYSALVRILPRLTLEPQKLLDIEDRFFRGGQLPDAWDVMDT